MRSPTLLLAFLLYMLVVGACFLLLFSAEEVRKSKVVVIDECTELHGSEIVCREGCYVNGLSEEWKALGCEKL